MCGNAARQLGTRRCPATWATQPVLLVFGDRRLDFRQLPHRVTPRFGVSPRQSLPTAAASRRLQHEGLVDSFGRQQRSFVLRVSLLATTFPLRGWLVRHRSGMRMPTGRRQRRVLRRHPQPGFELGNPREQRLHKRPHRRRHLVSQLRRYLRHPCHRQGVAEITNSEKTNPQHFTSRPVNDYHNRSELAFITICSRWLYCDVTHA